MRGKETRARPIIDLLRGRRGRALLPFMINPYAIGY
jgi:hypothetical protein